MCHVNLAWPIPKVGLFHHIGKSRGVIDVKAVFSYECVSYSLSNKDRIDSAPVHFIDERQTAHTWIGRVEASITDNLFPSMLYNAA